MNKRNAVLMLLVLGAALGGAALGGPAQAFPDKPLKVISGFAAGGGSDILLRTVLPRFSEMLGQPVVIDYRTGAGGNLAMEAVAKAAPDGYTLLMGTPGLATNPSLYEKLPFDPLRDLAPISLIGAVQNALVVHPALAATTVRELIALAKAQPGKLNYASPGTGTSQHLAAELFRQAAGFEAVHIPYKGGAQAQADVMGGQAQFMFNVLPSALPQVKAGKLRVLAVTGRARAESLPEVPTMIEAGIPRYTATTWNGILTTAGTAPENVAKLNDALVRAMKLPEMKDALAKLGQDVQWSTPEEFAAFLRDETEKWRNVIRATGIKAQ